MNEVPWPPGTTPDPQVAVAHVGEPGQPPAVYGAQPAEALPEHDINGSEIDNELPPEGEGGETEPEGTGPEDPTASPPDEEEPTEENTAPESYPDPEATPTP